MDRKAAGSFDALLADAERRPPRRYTAARCSTAGPSLPRLRLDRSLFPASFVKPFVFDFPFFVVGL